ncbi:MAG TPA: tryptophan synthase subunit alpha [Aggregatilineales bacterium]|nr:tryptophan synthase subunit alpha [Aggregatilineales bacterium]
MTTTTQTGLGAIEASFADAIAERRATFMPFFTLGYPDMPTSLEAVEALVAAGADAIELGVPFSDPVADGPVIQHSSQVSLDRGTTVADCISAVKTLRDRGITVPLVLMGYVNPLLAYGLERYAADSAAAGASGFIVPDLPPEEAGELASACTANGLALIPLLAPTSTPERIAQVTTHARGFVYLVSVTGVTGARDRLPQDLEAYTARVRAITQLPLAFGFGISQPDQVRVLAKLADGIIVASALIRLMEDGGIPAIRALAEQLRAAC